MQRILNRLAKKINSTTEEQQKLNKYFQMMQTDGWKIHVEWLLFLQGLIAEDMLSSKFTDQDSTQKDIEQRAYASVHKVLLFLMDPLAKARQLSKYDHVGATFQGATTNKNLK